MTLRGLALARMEQPRDPQGQPNDWTTYVLISCLITDSKIHAKVPHEDRRRFCFDKPTGSQPRICHVPTIGVEREAIDQLSAEVLEEDA